VHLKELGVSLGDRLRLLEAIEALTRTNNNVPPADLSSDGAIATHEAERRQLTVMFCDLVGSTELSTRLDPEDLQDLISAYQAACRNVIAEYDGFIAKYMGDGILVYFGYPKAHGDDPERAVRAGLGIVTAMFELGRLHAGANKSDLAVRVGINTGLVVVGDLIGQGASQEASVIGETPNVAARLQALAQPNQVVIGPLTHQLVAEAFACVDFGEHSLKGINEPMHAWRVLNEQSIENTHDAILDGGGPPLVGRDT
jgi:class 3 adenylate cyclase